MTKDFY